MILGAFGDSFLFGSDLQDVVDDGTEDSLVPSKKTWPALCANLLNLEYRCMALPGQGNKIIADDVLRAIKSKKNNMFYVINWSWIDRFDYIDNQRNVPKISEIWHTVNPHTDSEIAKFYYKRVYKDLDAKLQNLMYVKVTLDSLIENDCKFVMTYMDKLLIDKTFHCPHSVEYLIDKTEPYFNTFENLNFLDWSKQNNFAVSSDWHPLEQAHKKAAEFWLPKYKQLLNSSAKEDYLHAFI